VRQWIRWLRSAEVAGLAHSALTMDTADEVEWAVRPLVAELLRQPGETGRQDGDGGGGVVSLGV
jgi:hypothetical protein